MTIDQILKKSDRSAEDFKASERLKFLRKNAFNEHGMTYLAAEDIRTEQIKAAFKESGGTFHRELGWHAPNWIPGIKMVCCRFDDISEWIGARWVLKAYAIEKIRTEKGRKKRGKRELLSEFIGRTNETITFTAKFSSCNQTHFENQDYIFGGLSNKWDFYFLNEGKNIVRFTTAWYDPQKVKEFCGGRELTFKAKVLRATNEFGRKVTVIARPEIVRKDGRLLKDYARLVEKNPFGEAEEKTKEAM